MERANNIIWETQAKKVLELQKQAKYYTRIAKEALDQLVKESGQKSMYTNNYKLDEVTRCGSYNYKLIVQKEGIELKQYESEEYMTKSSSYWKLSDIGL